MQWGPSFADLCYREQVKLINYPFGMKPIGTPKGIQGASNVPAKFIKQIVRQYVECWEQEARELAKAAGKEEVDEEEEDDGARIDPEDLMQFVPWDEGK